MKTLPVLLPAVLAASASLFAGAISQQAYVKPNSVDRQFDYFGNAVAISGDTAAVAASGSFTNVGRVHIFVRSSAGVWTQQSTLTASNAESAGRLLFGASVALSGDTLVVGATGEDSGATGVNAPDCDGPGTQRDISMRDSGAAYVFTRAAGVWTQQAYLKASNTGVDDEFGTSVAVAGDTVVVGAPKEDSGATGVNGSQADNSAANAGAAYVFTRIGTTWTQHAYLKASNTEASDEFGVSVGISGNTVVVGAYKEDSGATGVNGTQANNAASSSGAAYVFTRSGTAWTQQAYLKASNTGEFDLFGGSVAIADSTVVVSAEGEDSGATGVGGNQADNSALSAGAAYVFTRSGTTWTQQAYLKASNTGINDSFGWAVAVSGDTVAVSARLEDSAATGVNGDGMDNTAADSGAAYVFMRGGATWRPAGYLKASNTDAGDRCGFAVSVSGGTVIAGAPLEDSNAVGVNAPVSGGEGTQADNLETDAGAAYIFTVPAGQADALDLNIAGSYVLAMAPRPDGKTVLGGHFSSVMGSTRSNMVQLHADGTIDAGFNPNANDQVFCTAVQPDGQVLYGGLFTSTLGQTRNRLARLNPSGNLDAGFDPNVNGDVDCLVLQPDRKILLSGAFTSVGGLPRNRIARLHPDGTVDVGFNPNANERVHNVTLQTDGKVLLGGKFTTVGGFTHNHVARVNADGTVDNTFAPSLDDDVFTLIQQPDGRVLMGGEFDADRGVTKYGIARVNEDGSPDNSFAPVVPGARVFSMALQADGEIIFCGEFTSVNGAPRENIARVTSSGALDEAFFTGVDATPYGVALLADGRVLLGGYFFHTGGDPRVHFARLANDDAPQSLNMVNRTRVEWLRGGTAPEVSQVTLELSTDGGNSWGSFGSGVRIGTSSNWQFTGISLPNSGTLRARGRTVGGYLNGSSGVVEQVTAYTLSSNAILSALAPNPRALVPDFAPLTTGYSLNVGFSNTSITVTPTAADAASTLQVRVNGGAFASVTSGTASAGLPLNVGGNTIDILVTALDGTTRTYAITVARRATVIPGDADDLSLTTDGTIFTAATQPDGKVIIGGNFTTVQGEPRPGVARLHADGTLDAGFIPVLPDSEVVNVLVLADGKILVSSHNLDTAGRILLGGDFDDIRGVARSGAARLLPDGTLDTGFAPVVPNYGSIFFTHRAEITSLLVQPDGKIVIGGRFGEYDDPRSNCARLNDDGTFDTGFNPYVDNTIICLAAQADGKILIGGGFSSAGGQPRSGMARLLADGSLDTAFNPTLAVDPCGDIYGYGVYSLTVHADGKITAGGHFGLVSGQPRDNMVRLMADGSVDLAFHPYVHWAPTGDSQVFGVTPQADGKLLISGDFTAAGGLPRAGFARLHNDPATQAISFPSPTVIRWTRSGSAPELTLVTFEQSTNGGASWTPLGAGTRIGTTSDWQITGIVLDASGQIRARGRTSSGWGNGSSGLVEQVSNYQTTGTADLSALVPSAGTLDPSFTPSHFSYTASVPNATGSITLTATKASGGGTIQLRLNGGSYSTVASGIASSPLPLNVGFNTIDTLVTAPDGFTIRVYTIAITRAAGAPVGEADALDANITGSYILSSAVQADGKLIIAGAFTSVQGVARNNIARLNADGTLDAGFNPNANDRVDCVAVQADGMILLGGGFTSVGGTPRSSIARLEATNGIVDAAFNPGVNGPVFCLAVQPDGGILLGGTFTDVGGSFRQNVARLEPSGAVDPGFDPAAGNTVKSMAVQSDGSVILGGDFGSVGGTPRNFIARVGFNGVLDLAFNPVPDNALTCVAVQLDGRILLAGHFTSVGGNGRNHIARLTATGTLDADFNPAANALVYTMAVQADGGILVGGVFTSIGGRPRDHTARLTAAGTADEGFLANTSGDIYSIAAQADGSVLIGGSFNSVGPLTRNLFARLHNDPAPQSLSFPAADQIRWTRGGSSPELSHVTFQQKPNGGAAWIDLGSAFRIGTTSNWQLTGVTLPAIAQIRARGHTSGGNGNGSSGLVEQLANFTIISGYTQWANTNIPSGQDATFAGDWNDDGISNGIAYIFGNARISYAAPGQIPEPPAIPPDADIYLERSTTLAADWAAIVSWENGAPPTFASGVSILGSEVRDTFAGPRAFYRYRAVLR